MSGSQSTPPISYCGDVALVEIRVIPLLFIQCPMTVFAHRNQVEGTVIVGITNVVHIKWNLYLSTLHSLFLVRVDYLRNSTSTAILVVSSAHF